MPRFPSQPLDHEPAFVRGRNAALAAAVVMTMLATAAHPAGAAEAAADSSSPPSHEAGTPTGRAAPPATPATPPGPGTPVEPATQPGEALVFRKFVDTDFVAARRGTSPIVLYFEADWCEPCKEMHARTFRDAAVIAATAGMELFRFDMTPSDGYVDIMKNSFKVIGAPTVIVFHPGGKEAARRFGFIPPDAFVEMLEKGRAPADS